MQINRHTVGTAPFDLCSTRRRTHKPNTAKRAIRAFERRLSDERSAWPAELQRLGEFCLLALKMIPGQERLLKHPAFVACVMEPIKQFEDAYAIHQQQKVC